MDASKFAALERASLRRSEYRLRRTIDHNCPTSHALTFEDHQWTESPLPNLAHLVRRLRSDAWLKSSRRLSDSAPVKARLAAEPWFIDRVDVDGDRVTLDGWSFSQSGRDRFLLNGEPFESVEFPLPRHDVAKLFWQRQDAAACGFRLTASRVGDAYPDGTMRVSRAIESDAIDAGRDSWWLPDPSRHPDLPDADRRFRVIGNRDPRGFLDSGATDFHRLDSVVRRVTGKALGAHANVLDWGVGCGRLARHFPNAGGRLSGCDIDHDNVAWCNDRLRGRFVASSLQPPLPFADGEFDVVYGISVFTHLRESLQDRWLDELRRVVRPGGIVLTTVHGETAVDFQRLSPAEYHKLLSAIAAKGLLAGGANHQLDGFVDEPGEYLNVFHHRDYVQRHWQRGFDVLHVIPGYIFTHDLVVMCAS